MFEELPQIEGYVPEQKTISITLCNILAIVLLAVAAGIGYVAIKVMYGCVDFGFNYVGLLAFGVMVIVNIALHELVHGVTWMVLLKKKFSHLSFGMMKGAVYCHIDVPMKKRIYVTGALMPLLLLGNVPWIVGIATGNLWWMLMGAYMISGAMGDISIVWSIRKESSDTLVYDHPSDIGCYVYHKAE